MGYFRYKENASCIDPIRLGYHFIEIFIMKQTTVYNTSLGLTNWAYIYEDRDKLPYSFHFKCYFFHILEHNFRDYHSFIMFTYINSIFMGLPFPKFDDEKYIFE